MKPTRYTVFQAAACSAAVFALVAKDYWRTFLHGGFAQPPPQGALVAALAMQTAAFATIGAVMWASTRFLRRNDGPERGSAPAMAPGAALKKALVAFPFICVAALLLESLSVFACEKLFGLTPPPQDLVGWLRPGVYPAAVRAALFAMVLAEAPILEEWLFRGIVFRGLCNENARLRFPVWFAMAASGFAFAAIHANAAAFVPLWFLGIAFAHLYRKTGTLLAPMAAHALFNLANLAICLLAPAAP